MKKTEKTKNETKFNQIKVDEIILECSVRYALGRRTYIVGVVCDEIERNLKKLSTKALGNIGRDIRNHGMDGFNGKNPYGDECDRKRWEKTLRLVETEELRRIKNG